MKGHVHVCNRSSPELQPPNPNQTGDNGVIITDDLKYMHVIEELTEP